MQTEIITIGDCKLPLSRFCDMIASRIAAKIADNNQPAVISQHKAHTLYGRRNIEKWVADGRLQFSSTTTGRRYFRTADLESLFAGSEGYIR